MDKATILSFIRDCITEADCMVCPDEVTCDDCIGIKARTWLDLQEDITDESKTTKG